MADILTVDSLTVAFDGFRAVDGLTLGVAERGVRVLIGPNGAGKSTLLDAVIGKVRATEGSIRFDGRELAGMKPHRIARLGVGRKFQAPGVLEDLSVEDNVALALLRGRGRRALIGTQLAKADADRIRLLLADAGLLGRARHLAGTLAHGEKQRLELAMTLAPDPRLILLDEPTAGMTREETSQTADRIRSLGEERAVLVVEHDMEFVERLDAPVSVLHQGRMLTEGPLERVRADERVKEVYLGRA